MSCENITRQLPLMLYGELSFDDEEAVHQHLESCPACRTELERTRRLHDAFDFAEPPLPSTLLSDSRRTLRLSVAALHEAGVHGKPSPFQFLRRFLSPSIAWKTAGAMAMLAAGFFAGRLSPDAARLAAFRETEPVVSRVRYVNPEDSGRVQVVVEETRQRVLEGGLDDQRIRSLLVAASREASDPGIRVETMDLLKQRSGTTEVRRALLAALQHDTNPGVRLKAIEALRESAAEDADTRRVLATVLLNDRNPGVRTQAIDLLIRKREPALVGVLQELLEREDNTYVRLKCQRALSEMNASVETF